MNTETFSVTTAVPLPSVKRGRISSKYPFDKLEAPVTVADEAGNPVIDPTTNQPVVNYASFGVSRTAKQMASTVYSATMRYATITGKDDKGKTTYNKTREFRCYDVDSATDPEGADH